MPRSTSRPSVVYAANNRGMFKTTGAGANWAAIHSGLAVSSFTPQVQTLDIDVNASGNAFVTGSTNASNFPAVDAA